MISQPHCDRTTADSTQSAQKNRPSTDSPQRDRLPSSDQPSLPQRDRLPSFDSPRTPRTPKSPGGSRRVRELKTSYEAGVYRVITQPSLDDPSILRACSARQLLASCGSILETSAGSSKDYEKSYEVKSIDYFLSHNWLTNRRCKFLALVLFFNMRKAAMVVAVFVAVVIALYAFKALPSDVEGFDTIYIGGVICLLVGPIVFYVALLFSHEISARTATGSVFLDKTCIHQTDSDLKQKGIDALGAFIAKSQAMVMIYSPIYFRRLWTVYEIATYLILQPDKRVVVLPTILPMFVFGGLPAFYVFLIVYRFAHCSVLFKWTGFEPTGLMPSAMTGMVAVPSCITICVLIRLWARQRVDMQDAIRDFSIADAECLDPSDRAKIFQHVIYFMKYKKLVPPNFSDEAVLTAFDNLVRRDIPKAIGSYIGRVCVPYQHVLAVFMPQAMNVCDGLGTSMDTQDPARSIFLLILHGMLWTAAVFPLSVAFVSWLMHMQLQLDASSCCEKMFVVASSSLVVAMLVLFHKVEATLMSQAMTSDLALCATVGLGIILSAATYGLYRPLPVVKGRSPLLPADCERQTSPMSTSTHGSARALSSTDETASLDSPRPHIVWL